MYDELVLLELKEFGGRALVSVESDMQKDPNDRPEAVIGEDAILFLVGAGNGISVSGPWCVIGKIGYLIGSELDKFI